MKAIARSYLHWRNMDADIENMLRECKKCNQKHNNTPRLESYPQEVGYRKHNGFFDPINGNYLLIVVDAFLK